MPDNKLISIIMPAYNAAAFISESIKSVQEQTYLQWELIIVDDGSTDNTKNIIADFTIADARIKYLYQENGKQGKARNNGLKNATGNYIAFLDADDIWVPHKLEKQIELITTTNATLVFAGINIIDENGKFKNTANRIINHHYCGEEGLKLFLQNNQIPMLTVLAEKAVIESSKGFDESSEIQYGEDYFLWLRMLQNGAVFVSIPEILGSYRKHKNQSIANTSGKALQMIQKLHGLQVPENLIQEKNRTICAWIKRYLSANRDIDKQALKKLIYFLPSPITKKIMRLLLPVLPCAVNVKIIKSTY